MPLSLETAWSSSPPSTILACDGFLSMLLVCQVGLAPRMCFAQCLLSPAAQYELCPVCEAVASGLLFRWANTATAAVGAGGEVEVEDPTAACANFEDYIRKNSVVDGKQSNQPSRRVRSSLISLLVPRPAHSCLREARTGRGRLCLPGVSGEGNDGVEGALHSLGERLPVALHAAPRISIE